MGSAKIMHCQGYAKRILSVANFEETGATVHGKHVRPSISKGISPDCSSPQGLVIASVA